MSEITRAFELVELGKYDEAEQLYEKILSERQTDNDKKVTMTGLSYLYIETEQYDRALTLYDEMISNETDDLERSMLFHQKGMVYRNKNDIDRSREFFYYERNILDDLKSDDEPLHVHYSDNHYELGLLNFNESNISDAKTNADAALAHANLSQDHIAIACAHRLQGNIYEKLGNNEDAKLHFNQSLEHFKMQQDWIGASDIQDIIDSMN